MKQFRFGHIAWMGPGTETIWKYDQRNPPWRWQPWADKFMDIIVESGHPVFKGGVALSQGEFRKEGRNEHFECSYQNQTMLIQFIYSTNVLTSFLALWRQAHEGRRIESIAAQKPQKKLVLREATLAHLSPLREATLA